MLMKKNYCTMLLLLFASIILGACSQKEETAWDNEQHKIGKVSDFAYLGEFHNVMMNNAKNSFSYNEKEAISMTLDERIDYVLNFNTEYANTALTNMPKEEIAKDMAYYRRTVLPLSRNKESRTRAVENKLTDEEIQKIFNDTILQIDNVETVYQLIDYAKDHGMITIEAYNCLNSLMLLTDESHYALISDSELDAEIDKIVKKIDDAKYTIDNPTLNTVGPVLSIADASLLWWEENPDISLDNSKIAPLVATDISGAIVGALGNLFYQALTTKTNRVNWTALGCNALSGGILASTGAIGKLSKFICGVGAY